MAKTITVEYEGKAYTLQYTRESIETMEKQGFRISELADKPMTVLPALFEGAFIAHHRFVKKDIVRGMFAMFSNKQDLIQRLAVMYNEPIEAMLDEPEEGKT